MLIFVNYLTNKCKKTINKNHFFLCLILTNIAAINAMYMKNIILFLLITIFPLSFFGQTAELQKEANQACFDCHSKNKVKISNDYGETYTYKFCSNYIISPEKYYVSNHKTFACTDCHSAEYDSFPHPNNLKFEMAYIPTCNDCHAGVEEYHKFNFEQIDSAYQRSIHHALLEEDFNCWSCHDPHTYKTIIRDNNNIEEAIAYNNGICLKCHGDRSQYYILTDKEMKDVIKNHEWLPRQEAHFRSVRCIECHTKVNDSILVSHEIVAKEFAVKKCVECHSKNSRLTHSLYKHQTMEKRKAAGFYNAPILKNSYVIGATRNYYLNIISIILFFGVVGGITIHTFLRIIKKR